MAIGFIFVEETQALPFDDQQNSVLQQQALLNNFPNPMQAAHQVISSRPNSELDDEDDDDETANLPTQGSINNQLGVYFNDRPIAGDQSYQNFRAVPAIDLKTAASHHHGHHAKGWLDMGAWTGKKGSFGWYDKHPVGKGK